MTTRKSNVHIDNYIDAVCSGEILFSKDVAALIELVEQKLTQENVWIDEGTINQAIDSIEKYFPLKLLKWQKFVVACMFGLFYDDDSLVFNEFLLYMGRGAREECIFSSTCISYEW